MSRIEASEQTRNGWVMLALLGCVVAFLGGSSRPDAVQLIALRPLCAVFLAAAFYFGSRARFASVKPILWMFGLLAGWMTLQLIPLPPALWQSLPGRAPVAELDRALGLGDVWRPISMVPARGINSLAGLVVPVAALLLAAGLGARARTLLLAIAALGALDAVMAILQVAGGSGSKLYLYAITNRGAPVGLFANQNHSAVFSALSLVVVAYLAIDSGLARRAPWARAALGALFLLILMAALIGGSRAGLLATALALVASGFLLWQGLPARTRASRTETADSAFRIAPRWLALAAIVAVGSLVAAFVLLDRAPALESIVGRSQFEDIRWRLLPVLVDMMATYWFVGTGFGSFEEVYHIFEPHALMIPSYINQAHNDLAQLVIEGGLPAVAIALAALLGFAGAVARMARAPDIPVVRPVFWVAVAMILLSASLVDYPLRAPLFQLVAVWLAVALCRESARPVQTTDDL